ncbi:hypothetical protein ACQKPT_02025 [Pseudomonas monteilii]|uniref:hypothetical protein n=1 Tax=Pseudomonas monteilii TaxID=76759 RepID=UPI003CFBE9B2
MPSIRPKMVNKIRVISDESLVVLHNAAASTGSLREQERNEVLLSLYEHTGARRDEGINIRVADVLSSVKTGSDFASIRIPGFGTRWAPDRWVPVPMQVANDWVKYINTTRKECLKESGGIDHGYLLINPKNGKQLSGMQVVWVLRNLSSAAGFESPVGTRTLRDRFVVLNVAKLVRYSERVSFADPLTKQIEIKQFQEKIIEIIGHSSINSLAPYMIEEKACHTSSEAYRTAIGECNRALQIFKAGVVNKDALKRLIVKALKDL